MNLKLKDLIVFLFVLFLSLPVFSLPGKGNLDLYNYALPEKFEENSAIPIEEQQATTIVSNFTTSPISQYKVVLYGEKGTSIIGAYIHCFYKSKIVLTCDFYNDENNVPANSKNFTRVHLRYPMSKFSDVLDVLRNERPVYFGFIHSTKVGYISTYREPVGEAE